MFKRKDSINELMTLIDPNLCYSHFSGLRSDALRFFYAYGILTLVSMAAVSYGLYI